jgi:hypothetical protein
MFMFNTKNLVHDIKDVPVPWVFEHFCELKEKLSGQDVKVKSMFNPKEKTPSMCIYFDDKKQQYKFKDFSTGIGGDHLTLVKEITSLSFYKSCGLIVEKYNDFVLHNNGGYDLKEFKQASKYKVEQVCFRSWSSQDQYYWTQFNIGSKLLDQYHVRPLDYYKMTKDDKELYIKGNYIYGYYKEDGALYKIYQPKTQDKKFLKIRDYVQGSEQLEGHHTLVIASSLKDIMSLKSLRLNVDVIAPDSENSMIRKNLIDDYKEMYSTVIAMFDNDEPGIKAMEKYRDDYKIHPLLLPMSKDLSDSIRDFGAKEVRNRLVPLLNKKTGAYV